MSKEVIRLDPVGYDGLSAKMEDHECGDYVRAEDYDALLAERDALKEVLKSALKTAEFERHPARPWHYDACAALQGEQP